MTTTILKYRVNQGINKTNGWIVERRKNLKTLTIFEVFKLEFAINFAICIKQKVNVKDFILLAQEMNEAHLENNIISKGEKKLNMSSENLPEVAMPVQIHVWVCY